MRCGGGEYAIYVIAVFVKENMPFLKMLISSSILI